MLQFPDKMVSNVEVELTLRRARPATVWGAIALPLEKLIDRPSFSRLRIGQCAAIFILVSADLILSLRAL